MDSKCLTVFMAGMVSILLLVHAPAAAGQKNTSNINVTTTVHDNDAGGSQLLTRSDDYNGLGQATYSAADYRVSAYISTGRWYLDLYGQQLRTLYITPNDAINGSQPAGPPPGYYWQNVEAYSGCYDQNGNMVPFWNILTSSNNCSFGVDFTANRIKYKFVMNPYLPAPGPVTGLATVMCNKVSNGQCVNWTIAPNMAASANNVPRVANLYQYTKTGLVFVGQYYNTYRVDVSNP